MGFGYAPEQATAIVVVDLGGLPGVLVDEEVALGIDVALAGLEGRLDFPDPVQLVTGQVLVDMASLEDVRVLQLGGCQAVAVVRDVDFLLADQFPVVAIRCPVEHVVVVRGAQAVGGDTRAVVGDLRCAAYAALAGVVHPGLARLLDLVEWLAYQ
ncbi:hypothetical protein D3C81_1679780 [compost metagenome]